MPILYRFRNTVGRFIYGCADFLRLALKSWQAALNGSVKSIREQAKDEISIRRASCRDRRFLTEATNGKASAVRGVCPPLNRKLFVVAVSDVRGDETVGRAPSANLLQIQLRHAGSFASHLSPMMN